MTVTIITDTVMAHRRASEMEAAGVGSLSCRSGEGIELDDAVEGPAAGRDQRLDRTEHDPRLALEVPAVGDASILVVGDLPREVQDRLGAGDFDGLAVARGVVDAGRHELLDAGHGSPPSWTLSSRWGAMVAP
jgi:hypothetical protein